MVSISNFLVVLPILCLGKAKGITTNTNANQDQNLRGSSKYSHKLDKMYQKSNLHNLLSSTLDSICEPGEVAFEISILTDGNRQGKISWAVDSSDGAITQSSPLFVSHASVYNQELCFDDKICHRFTLNDASTTLPLQNEDTSITSIRVSINGLTVLENPGRVLNSFSFKFGQCEGRSGGISKSNGIYPSPITETETETVMSPNPTPAPSERQAAAAGKKGDGQTPERFEIEILVLIVLLLLIIIRSATCCYLAAFVGAIKWLRNYLNPESDEEDTSDDDVHVHDRDNDDDDDGVATNLVVSQSMQEDRTDVVQRRGFFSRVRSRFYTD